MPTYSFARALPQLQKLILRKLRYLDPEESPSGTDAAIVNEAIDLRLKELHALGVLWWQVAGAASNVSLTGGSATASLSALTDYLFPVSFKLRVGSEDRDIEIIGHQQYQDIADKAESGEPEQAFFSGSTVYLWPVPNADYTAKLTYQAIAEDTASPAAVDIPAAMLRSFVTLVAADLVDDFGTPENLAQRILIQAKEAERTLRTLNAERIDTARQTPDYF
jgi:hypothetical protein